MKCLPPTSIGKKSTKRNHYLHNINTLLKFEHISTPIQDQDSSCHPPYIIARGPSKSAISQYMLVLDSHIINLPVKTFSEAFDILFKSYFTFNIKYDSDLKVFWHFFQNFIYAIDCEKPSTRMLEVHNKFQNFFEKTAKE